MPGCPSHNHSAICQSTNGVAAIHSDLLRKTTVRDLAELFPERFNNKTNGVTPRRWLLKSNPGLAALLTEAAGPGWVTDYGLLREPLERLASDAAFRERFHAVKRENKVRLARIVARPLPACGTRRWRSPAPRAARAAPQDGCGP